MEDNEELKSSEEMAGFFDRINGTAKSDNIIPPSLMQRREYHEPQREYRERPRGESLHDQPPIISSSRRRDGCDFSLFAPKPVPASKADIWADTEDDFGTYSFCKTRSELDPPLINQVMNATTFVNSGNSGIGGGNPALHTTHQTQVRRPKYLPPVKSALEHFDESTQIHEGPQFEKHFGAENDCEISVTGGDGKCPIISSFDECNFCEEIEENIRLRRYRHPTQIQKCIMPLIIYKKHDIMGHSQTGSGKTASFVLPIINHIQKLKKKTGEFQNGDSPYAVIIAPTKELAEQLGNDARAFSERTDVRVAVSYGDMPVRENINQIRYGCDIFVATCGRLTHYVRDEIVKLDKLLYFIMDEADRLLNDSFVDCIRAVKQHKSINFSHRTFMFSATFDDGIQGLAREFLRNQYFFVRIGEMNRPADTVVQTFIKVQKYDKQDLLIRLLMERAQELQREDGSTYYEVAKTIVFVQQKRQSDRLAVALAQAGFIVISLNADRTLKQRSEAYEKFMKGIYQILVATNVAARGLNFPLVEHVINYDLPEQEESSYIHRIGRGGRIGNMCQAISFFDPEGEEVRRIQFYIENLQSTNQRIPAFMREIYENQKASHDDILRAYGREIAEPQRNNEWF